MNTPLLKSIVINFNYFIIYYVLVINFIYFIQLILAAFNLSDYVKKIRYSDYKKYITSDNMIPIAGSCGDKPNPKNVTLDSCMIACRNTNNVPTKIWDNTKGKICSFAIHNLLLPNFLDNNTYSDVLICNTSALKTLVKLTQCENATAIITPNAPLPNPIDIIIINKM